MNAEKVLEFLAYVVDQVKRRGKELDDGAILGWWYPEEKCVITARKNEQGEFDVTLATDVEIYEPKEVDECPN